MGHLTGLRAWYCTESGQQVLNAIEARTASLVSCVFGYYAVQMGRLGEQSDLLKNCTINQKLLVEWEGSSDIHADPSSLPFPRDSVDLVVLPNTLNFVDDAHQALREAERILVPEGHVLIVGFNPYSYYGLWKLLKRRKGKAPWTGTFYSLHRIKDWLSLLGFDVVQTEFVAHRPPFAHRKLYKNTAFLGRFGSKWINHGGGVYILLAKKRVATLKPLKEVWKPKKAIVPKEWAEPTTRGRFED